MKTNKDIVSNMLRLEEFIRKLLKSALNLYSISGLLILLLFSACSSAKEGNKKEAQKMRPVERYMAEDAEIEAEEEIMVSPSTVAANGMKKKSRTKNGGGMIKQDEKPIVHNTEEYDKIDDNEFMDVSQNPLSTFSIDVDNAAYTNVRRYLNGSQLPPKDAVRIEEMINYFDYKYTNPDGEHPFSVNIEMSEAPWHKENKLIHIGLQGKKLDYDNIKPCNLVFLLDVSGSMSDKNKLPLLKKALKMLVKQLDDRDKVAIAVYASSEGLVLPATPASEKNKIIDALDKLNAGGSTAGGAGIKLAYKVAMDNLIKDGNNRVILATDGDFNVGVSSTSDLVRMIEEKRQHGIYLTILGLGMGNYKDGRMEQISNAGNGNYFYIDNIKEAEKVFVKEMRANLFTIAKDVKIQIEFNPTKVKAYRLIGYVNRKLKKEDFDDDKKDAGELGAGHTVTALYEIIPAGSSQDTRKASDLKYQDTKLTNKAKSDEVMTVKLRYKPPKEDKSKLIEMPIAENYVAIGKTSDNFRFSASVAAMGMLLRDSKFKGDADFSLVRTLANGSKGEDENGYRQEFIGLIKTAELLKQ